MQDRLEKLFGLNFTVQGRTITIDDAETDIIDKVLYYSFEFTYYEDAGAEETGDIMQELEYNG